MSDPDLTDDDKWYRKFIETIVDYALCMLSTDGTILSWNEGAERISGYSSDDAVGSEFTLFYGVPESESAQAVCSRATTFGRYEYESQCTRKDGSQFWLDAVIVPHYDDAGSVTRFFFVGRDCTDRRRAAEELSNHRLRLTQLTARLENVREEERIRISRELHDELGQSLTALKIGLSYAHIALDRAASIEECRNVCRQITGLASSLDRTIDSVRRIATQLRPPILDAMGIVPALKWHIREFSKVTGIKTTFSCNSELNFLSEEQRTVLFRATQELLTNSAKHSSASSVRVILHRFPKSIELEVLDDGVGLREEDLTKANSLGLIGLRERAHSVGGVLHIRGIRNAGTRARLNIPIESS